jgi:hypothetical protein
MDPKTGPKATTDAISQSKNAEERRQKNLTDGAPEFQGIDPQSYGIGHNMELGQRTGVQRTETEAKQQNQQIRKKVKDRAEEEEVADAPAKKKNKARGATEEKEETSLLTKTADGTISFSLDRGETIAGELQKRKVTDRGVIALLVNAAGGDDRKVLADKEYTVDAGKLDMALRASGLSFSAFGITGGDAVANVSSPSGAPMAGEPTRGNSAGRT